MIAKQSSPNKSQFKSPLEEKVIALPATNSPQKQLPDSSENQTDNPLENQEDTKNIFIRKSRWSPWFPYPSSWLRTFGLLIWLSIVVSITMFWARLVGVVLSIMSANLEPLFKASAIGLLISGFIFAYLHHILFGRETPNFKYWLPSSRSCWEGVYALIVMIISFLVVAIIVIPFIPKRYCDFDELKYWRYCIVNLQEYNYFWNSNSFWQYKSFWRHNFSFLEILAIISSVLWLFITAYLYQIEFLIRKNFSAQKLSKSIQSLIKRLKAISKFLLIAIVGLLLTFLVSFIIKNDKPLQNLIQSYVPRSSSTPIASISPTISPSVDDPFVLATENALQASKLVQLAKTKVEWQQVANYWGSAVTFMQAVPTSHPKHTIAQKKILEYQANLDYAKRAGNLAVN